MAIEWAKNVTLTLFTQAGFFALLQVLMIDIVLAGDNAVVIGMAAARVPAELRKKVILWGLDCRGGHPSGWCWR